MQGREFTRWACVNIVLHLAAFSCSPAKSGTSSEMLPGSAPASYWDPGVHLCHCLPTCRSILSSPSLGCDHSHLPRSGLKGVLKVKEMINSFFSVTLICHYIRLPWIQLHWLLFSLVLISSMHLRAGRWHCLHQRWSWCKVWSHFLTVYILSLLCSHGEACRELYIAQPI